MSIDLDAVLRSAEVSPVIRRKPVAGGSRSIITWIKQKGGINYKRDQWKGEINHAKECVPTLVVNKAGKGLTLDELSLMAYAEGWITEASPQTLLDAILTRQMRDDVKESEMLAELERLAWEHWR